MWLKVLGQENCYVTGYKTEPLFLYTSAFVESF